MAITVGRCLGFAPLRSSILCHFRFASKTSVDIHKHKLSRPVPRLAPADKQRLQKDTRGSLVAQTLHEMEQNEDFKITASELKKFGQAKLTKEERLKRKRALDGLGLPDFTQFIKDQNHGTTLQRRSTEVLQINIGLYCNQACSHCHVESSPKRTELMQPEAIDRCLELMRASAHIHTVDITGGAPELCPGFRPLVLGARNAGKQVIDRCNLTALMEPDQEDTATFLAENCVQVVASLPCYSAKNVNLQRGKGVFDKSISALLTLNDLGYGHEGSGLILNLVYNPLGGYLPPEQGLLQAKYKEELWRDFGIVFNELFNITNMPIKRFADFLHRRGELEDYMELLVRNFNVHTLDNLMCRNLVSVNYDGSLYDCDFNQQLALQLENSGASESHKLTIFDINNLDDLKGRDIRVDNHCYGCTAGSGSS